MKEYKVLHVSQSLHEAHEELAEIRTTHTKQDTKKAPNSDAT